MDTVLPAELAPLRQVLGRPYLPVASLSAFVMCRLSFFEGPRTASRHYLGFSSTSMISPGWGSIASLEVRSR